MRAEKKLISAEYVARLNASPFFLVVDYKGLTVQKFTELRKRLIKAGGEVHVVKNTIFSIAATEAGRQAQAQVRCARQQTAFR